MRGTSGVCPSFGVLQMCVYIYNTFFHIYISTYLYVSLCVCVESTNPKEDSDGQGHDVGSPGNPVLVSTAAT